MKLSSLPACSSTRRHSPRRGYGEQEGGEEVSEKISFHMTKKMLRALQRFVDFSKVVYEGIGIREDLLAAIQEELNEIEKAEELKQSNQTL